MTLILLKQETGNFCASEPTIGSLTPAQTASGGWARYEVPTADFNCAGGGIALGDVTQLEFQNTGERDAAVCIAELKIVR